MFLNASSGALKCEALSVSTASNGLDEKSCSTQSHLLDGGLAPLTARLKKERKEKKEKQKITTGFWKVMWSTKLK